MNFYVYEWYIKDTNEIIYVGKGSKKRYLSKQHNKLFKEFINRFICESRIVKYFENEQDAYYYEYSYIEYLRANNQCVCNICKGGNGGGGSVNKNITRWTEKERLKYSQNNVMKDIKQRERMCKNNPMKNKEYAKKNGIAHRKPIFIGNKVFNSITEASKYFNTTKTTICDWCRKGHFKKDKNIKCGYVNQQPSYMNTDKSSIEGSTTNE